MRYRWKLMILLLVIALVPLGTMRMVGIRGVRLLSNELVSRARKNLSQQATDRLQLIVESYAQMLRQGRQQLEIALILQAGEVEHHLAGPVDEPTDGVYFAKNFGPQRILRRGLVTTLDHFRIIADNKVELLKVTYASQVFNAAPGVKLENIKSDIARLAGMTPVYHRLSDYLKDLVIWQYTALQNGLYSVYPGHDNFPAAYDPRDQPWYRQAFMGRGYWTDQFIDAETGRQVVAVSMPVTGPHGKTAGATALIMPIRNFLEQRLLLENIPPQTRAFVVYPAIQPQTGRRGARIMVREDPNDSRHRWQTPLTTDWLNADDQDQFQAVLDDFENGRSNIRRMHFNDCDCLWVYGAIHEKTFLVLVTPSAAIFEPALRSEEYIQIQIQRLLDLTNYGIAGILVVIVILALAFSRTVTRPMRLLAEATRRLARGNFDTRVDIRTNDEFGYMARVFNEVGPRLEENYHLRQSLELAMEVQQNLLPKSDPRSKGLDIAGRSDYCEETGGDYYDYLESDGSKIVVVVGDVSGHGISSALLMTTARAFLRQRASRTGTLAEIVSDVNRQVTWDVEDSGQFMTLFYTEINVGEKILRWVRAGHDTAFFYDSTADTFDELGGQGLPLGISETAIYEQRQREIKSGQIIVIGTDGIWETRNPRGQMFGKQNLQAVIRAHADKSARNIIDAVMGALEDFRYPMKKKEDDITLVIVKINLNIKVNHKQA